MKKHKKDKVLYFIFHSFSLSCFALAFLILLSLIIISQVYGSKIKNGEILAYGLIWSMLALLILFVIMHIIAIPFALNYYRYRFFELGDELLTWFNIFFILTSIIALPRWREQYELQQKNELKNLAKKSKNDKNDEQ
ncbi:hypothetical protein MCAL160_0932 [Mycoplasmopsis californica HAZ160_1]|uniref:Uncharacterized protein n=2 Tax=Mycoplasmopsis californica TaxID=2113 RepID=A0A059XVM3_9BACT|nr:hypothetical protein [Mycoplasmopsis californica]AIA29262.1 hypothetical protein MCFN_00445 [Mycoplasmopsis californica]BAP01275.1 hypothetical protein MCAL160_0932 [Mycoplasmopsis californica HAZ160_1]BBG41149.1 hypothetical protein MCAL106_0932 [Mycoplasmopsis californica]BBG41742.1 hypothetical protein MCAL106E_0932 [Mycoplasmopsis californica]BBG42336.1 hypothetical protein MCAL106L_0932 [Mycoplasmopsis californica]